MPTSPPPRGRSRSIPAELGSLLAANALTLWAALHFGFGPLDVLWVYWMQSAGMGLRAAFPRAWRCLPPRGAFAAARSPPFDPGRIARVLLLPYALFHLLYLIALIALGLRAASDGSITVTDGESGLPREVPLGRLDLESLLLSPVLAAALVLAHRERGARAAEAEPKQVVVSSPLLDARVLPLHAAVILTLVLGGFGTVVAFIALKTAVERLIVLLLAAGGGRP